jgi:hypothetical protein
MLKNTDPKTVAKKCRKAGKNVRISHSFFPY